MDTRTNTETPRLHAIAALDPAGLNDAVDAVKAQPTPELETYRQEYWARLRALREQLDQLRGAG